MHLKKKLFPKKSQFIANHGNLLGLQKSVDVLNIATLSAREIFSSKRKFLIAKNVTFFAALLKSFPPLGDVSIPPHLVKHAKFFQLICKVKKKCYDGNLCLLRADCMQRASKKRLEEQVCNLLNAFLNVNSNVTVENFQVFVVDGIHVIEHLAKVNILEYDLEVSVKELLENLHNNLCKNSTHPQFYCVITIRFATLLM